jgi:hypothetical protein
MIPRPKKATRMSGIKIGQGRARQVRLHPVHRKGREVRKGKAELDLFFTFAAFAVKFY